MLLQQDAKSHPFHLADMQVEISGIVGKAQRECHSDGLFQGSEM